MRDVVLLLATVCCAAAQTKTTWNDLPAYTLSNGLIEVTVLPSGAAMPSVTLADDKQKLNPLWDPIRFAKESATAFRGNPGGVGHFLCVDGFGGTSKEEQAAGLQGHGEAHRRTFDIKLTRNQNGVQTLVLETELPMTQEHVLRTFETREGENIVYVRTQLQSLTAFDRPMVWAEHGTIGSPFLEAGVTVVDTVATKSQTRPYTAPQRRRLAPGKDFDWPMAPLNGGQTVDLRAAPLTLGSGDHTTQLMEPSRTYAFATALNPQKRRIVGWVWRSADFPWLQNWESYPTTGKLARGLEFSTQPYDIPRRQAVDMHQMFGAPTYQWLPARSTVEKSFVFFYANAPEGMTKVSDVRVEKGQLIVEDGMGHRIELRAAGSF